MSDAEVQTMGQEMTVGKGFLIYAGIFVTQIVLIALATKLSWFSGAIPFLAYFVFGFLLNRIVLRGLIEWHPTYNTLQNVSSAKLGMLLVWPFRYLVLFFQLLVNKHL